MSALWREGHGVNGPFPLQLHHPHGFVRLLGDGLRLRRNSGLSERQIVVRVNPVASRIDDGRRNEDDQTGLLALGRLATEQASHERNIAQNWKLVLGLGALVQKQSAEDDRLAIPYNCAGHHLAKPENRQWSDLRESVAGIT